MTQLLKSLYVVQIELQCLLDEDISKWKEANMSKLDPLCKLYNDLSKQLIESEKSSINILVNSCHLSIQELENLTNTFKIFIKLEEKEGN